MVHVLLYLLSLFVLCSSFSDAFACRLLVISMQSSRTAELCAGIDLVVCASSVVQDLLQFPLPFVPLPLCFKESLLFYYFQRF